MNKKRPLNIMNMSFLLLLNTEGGKNSTTSHTKLIDLSMLLWAMLLGTTSSVP